MPLMRTKPLPVARNRGRLVVPSAVVASTQAALQGFRGGTERHEGLAFWLGRRVAGDAVVAAGVIPACEHGPQGVFVSAAGVGDVARAARDLGLGIVAQVHSHPGDDTRHSDGDDDLILMPFEGMFSLVVGRYGDGGFTLDRGLGLHQYQERKWVRIASECRNALTIVPPMLGIA